MSTDENLRPESPQACLYPALIVSGIASDMCDQHRHLLAVELLPLRIDHPQGSSVDIAVNPAQGLERGNRIGRFDVPEIPGVPDFIDFGQEFA